MKNVYCIRHGTAEHNVLFKEVGEKAYMMLRDSNLTDAGQIESVQMGKYWIEKNNIELVLVSPLTRTLQTATNIFKDVNVKMLALDELKEYPASYENINHRKDRKELVLKYHPKVNFKQLTETDKLWDTENHETIEQLDDRVKYMKDVILKRKETNIAIVSHTTFLAYFLYGEIVDYDNELKHCFPYKLYLKSNTTYTSK
jgi:broad specificity phosphatase PhoE